VFLSVLQQPSLSCNSHLKNGSEESSAEDEGGVVVGQRVAECRNVAVAQPAGIVDLMTKQAILTEGEGSERLTFHLLDQISSFPYRNYNFFLQNNLS
jgi:hypothetical protein